MKCVVKLIASVGIIFFCLQYTIVFDRFETPSDSFKVVVEFKQLQENESSVISPAQFNDDAYKHIYQENELYAAEAVSQKDYFVSRDSLVRGVKSDIERTFVGNTEGVWNLHIVFKKNFTEKLANLSVEDWNQKLAIIINSDLLAAPVSKNDLLAQRNTRGQYELIIPTNVRQKKYAERILNRYNMAP